MNRNLRMTISAFAVILLSTFAQFTSFGFEGRITAALTRGGETQTLLYTVAINRLRIEQTETNRPHAKNIVDRDTGALTLLFPHNRSFVRLKTAASGVPSLPRSPGMPQPPGTATPSAPGNVPAVPAAQPAMPPPIGPTNLPGIPPPPATPPVPAMPQMPAGVGPQGGPGTPRVPAMPMMPMMPMQPLELKATGQTTNLLGYTCTKYELNQRGETMEIWATDKLLPFQAWLPNQTPRFGPRMIEEQWGELLKAKKLFPLLAILKFENGPERLRFEVKSITPEKIEDRDGTLFQPPPDYREIEPLPF